MSEPTPPPAPRYIWQHAAWPKLTFDALALAPALDQARLEQGKLLGLLEAIGLDQAQEVQRELWVQEALANHHDALTLDRLCRWQSALFPGGTSGITRITLRAIGAWPGVRPERATQRRP